MTLDEFTKATGATSDWYPHIVRAVRGFTPLQVAHFLAQVGHESGGFKRLVENLNYGAEGLRATWPGRFNAQNAADYARQPEKIANYVYGGRMGNSQAGDGWRYRGRGLIQLTGRHNYRLAGDALDLPLESNPDIAMRQDVASQVAVWYWKNNNINRFADRDDVLAVTRAVNGGTNGIDDRRARTARAKKAFGL